MSCMKTLAERWAILDRGNHTDSVLGMLSLSLSMKLGKQALSNKASRKSPDILVPQWQ